MFDPNATQRIVAKAKRRIVPNWKSRINDYSTRALALGTAGAAAWVAMPDSLQAHLPADYVAWSLGALNAIGLVSKFIVQGPLPEDKSDDGK